MAAHGANRWQGPANLVRRARSEAQTLCRSESACADRPAKFWRSMAQDRTSANKGGAARRVCCPFPPVPAPERASANECEDLPLTTSGARPTGILHLPEVCGELERRAALLSTTSAHLLRTASSQSRLHARARMHLRADGHLTVWRALRRGLHGESADVVQPGRDRALYCVGRCRQQ